MECVHFRTVQSKNCLITCMFVPTEVYRDTTHSLTTAFFGVGVI